jgi:hypothetical protein
MGWEKAALGKAALANKRSRRCKDGVFISYVRF